MEVRKAEIRTLPTAPIRHNKHPFTAQLAGSWAADRRFTAGELPWELCVRARDGANHPFLGGFWPGLSGLRLH